MTDLPSVCDKCKGSFATNRLRAEHNCSTMQKFVRAQAQKQIRKETLKKVCTCLHSVENILLYSWQLHCSRNQGSTVIMQIMYWKVDMMYLGFFIHNFYYHVYQTCLRIMYWKVDMMFVIYPYLKSLIWWRITKCFNKKWSGIRRKYNFFYSIMIYKVSFHLCY
jgi:hypothetical protein